jgi:hypothetical protein
VVPRSSSSVDIHDVKSSPSDSTATASQYTPKPQAVPPPHFPSNLTLPRAGSGRNVSSRRIATQITLQGGPLADGAFSYDAKAPQDESLTVVERVSLTCCSINLIRILLYDYIVTMNCMYTFDL